MKWFLLNVFCFSIVSLCGQNSTDWHYGGIKFTYSDKYNVSYDQNHSSVCFKTTNSALSFTLLEPQNFGGEIDPLPIQFMVNELSLDLGQSKLNTIKFDTLNFATHSILFSVYEDSVKHKAILMGYLYRNSTSEIFKIYGESSHKEHYNLKRFLIEMIFDFRSGQFPASIVRRKKISSFDLNSDSSLILIQVPGYYEIYLAKSDSSTVKLSRFSKDIIVSHGSIEAFGIQFINTQIGYLYGYDIGFAYYPFVFKTIDGGKHWERIIFAEEASGFPLSSGNFHMFSEEKGIFVYDWSNISELTYFTTKDGWKTKKEIKLKTMINSSKNEMDYNDPINCSFGKNGEVTIKLNAYNSDSYDDNSIFLISKNFGESFKTKKQPSRM